MTLIEQFIAAMKEHFPSLSGKSVDVSAITAERDTLAAKVADLEKRISDSSIALDAEKHVAATAAADLKAEQGKVVKLSADLAKKAELDKTAFDAAVAEGVAKLAAQQGIKPIAADKPADAVTGTPKGPELFGLARYLAAVKSK